MKVAVVQFNASDDPAQNAEILLAYFQQAAEQDVDLIATPEVSNCVSLDRQHQRAVLRGETYDPVLQMARDFARKNCVAVALGSLALNEGRADGRFVNRSIWISDDGAILARYDKIHMFDVTISEDETYRESAAYAPGRKAVSVAVGEFRFGLTICFDLRFPALYQSLAKSGVNVLMVPSAFSPVTGRAHWESLLRARAIETGSYVIAAAQTGSHPTQSGEGRRTYGHSLIVSPWGKILHDAGTKPNMGIVTLALNEVEKVRKSIPTLACGIDFEGPL